MKKIFYILLTMGVVFMPHAIYADIHSTTNASASTGGNVVSPNGSVTTGSENASVDVSNIVGDNGNGTSTINIESGTNGQTNHQTITKPIQSGRTSVTEYATSSTQGTSAGAHVKVLTHVEGKSSFSSISTTGGSATSSSVTARSGWFVQIVVKPISTWFENFFNFFWR